MLSALRLRLPRAALLAWLALFGLVVAPSVSRALAAVDPIAYAAICSVAGNANPGGLLDPDHAGDACGLCAVAALPLAPALDAAGFDLQSFSAPSLGSPSLPARAAPWRIARSRAPPTSL
ncbi:MAG: DUF2946 family protein [Burkholderiales bacterium]|nr:DUF2946 family protein [Burkholderiales bacterium]